MKEEIISMVDGMLSVPANPAIPFIIGDGTGPDIWNASVRVFDEAVLKAYGTYDFNRLMKNAQLLKTSEFADTIISMM